MKYMGWGPDDLASAQPEVVLEIIRMINEDIEAAEKARQ